MYLDFKLKEGAKHIQPVPKGKEMSDICIFIKLSLLSMLKTVDSPKIMSTYCIDNHIEISFDQQNRT